MKEYIVAVLKKSASESTSDSDRQYYQGCIVVMNAARKMYIEEFSSREKV